MTWIGIRRIELLLLRGGRWAVVVLAVLGIVCLGVGAWNYQHPPTTTVTDHEDEQTIASALEVSADVSANSSLFESGTEVVDPPVFLTESMAPATVTRRTTVPAGEPVAVTHELSLVYRVTRDGDTLWSNRTTLTREETTTESGQVVTRSRVDIDAVARRLATIRDEVGSAGSVEVVVQTNVTYRTDQYEGRLSDSAAITVQDTWYDVGPAESSQFHSRPVDRAVTVPFSSPLPYGGPLGLGTVLLALSMWGAYLRFSAISEPTLERRIHRARYAEWISEVSLASDATEDAIAVNTLEGLVDIAFDTDKRVLHDPERDRYLVIDEPTRYYYDPETADRESEPAPPCGWDPLVESEDSD